MKKLIIFVLVIIVTFITIDIIVQINLFLHSSIEIAEIAKIDSTILPKDTILIPGGMTDEEFTREMMRGVQGNFTLEQVDSMQKSWTE